MSDPVDFGLDLWNDGDLDPFGRTTTGFEALAQALLRRLDTPTGSLPDDEDGDYGYDLSALLSEGMTDSDLAAVASRVEHEFGQDERVGPGNAKVVGTLLNRSSITLKCTIRPRDAGPFTFVLAISDVAKTILTIAEGP